MRIVERLQYCTGLILYILFFITLNSNKEGEEAPAYLPNVEKAKLPMLIVTASLTLLCQYVEGLRIHQLPFFIGLIIHSGLVWVLEQPSRIQIVNIIATVLLMGSVTLTFLFGESNLERLKVTGPFEVGHREFRSTKLGSEISVYYPVDRTHFKRHFTRKRNTSWLRHGDKTLLGLVKASVPYGREDPPPACVFRYFGNVKLMTLDQGDLASVFLPSNANSEKGGDMEKGIERKSAKNNQLQDMEVE
jgi:hypothetical protein